MLTIRIDQRRGVIVGPPPPGRFKATTIPLVGAVATLADSGPDKHVTATRLVTIGVFAFAKKKDRGRIYLTITNGEDYLVAEIKRKDARAAHELVARINAAARPSS